jgi:hypothetical protein
MDVNKSHWSTEGDHIRLSMPISKVDKEKRTVSGFATLDNLDRQGDVVPVDASLKAFERFRGNLREMHQPIAAGKVVSFKQDKYFDPETKKFYNGVFVSAYVSKGAQDTWEKVLDGTLTGFSIGGEINKTDDVYDEEMQKTYRVIKEYDLSELSLVDNPANQFANVLSIEKGILDGYLSKANIENVYWCRPDDIIQISEDNASNCPQCDKSMSNIGFVETNDEDKAGVIKSIIAGVKISEVQRGIAENSFVKFDNQYGKVVQVIVKGGARLSSEESPIMAKSDDPVVIINTYSQNGGTIVPSNRRVIKNISSLEKVNAISKSEVKEVSKMDSDVIVVDEVDKAVEGGSQEQINPEPTALPVIEETTEGAETLKAEKPGDMGAEEDEVEKAKKEKMEEDAEKTEKVDHNDDMDDDKDDDDMDEEAMKSEEPKVTKSDEDSTVKMISEISESLSSALSTLAETVKALDAKIEGINKAVAGISSEVEGVKDSFGKRVDAVEKETAFRKSADLGEILQEEPVKYVEKSTWGGRFLTNADLFN